MGPPVGAWRCGQPCTGHGEDHPWTECPCAVAGHMCQRLLLRGQQCGIFQRVGDLEDEPFAGRARDEEILVAFAGER